MRVAITCNPGLEEVSIQECSEITGKPFAEVHRGLICGKVSEEDIFRLNYLGKTIHRVILVLDSGEFTSLEDLYTRARSIDYTEYILPDQRFAVKTKRSGVHNFTSVDVSRIVGQAVVDSYLESKNIRIRANLKHPDVRFLVEVRDNWFFLGIDTTGNSLHNRWYRTYTYITALKSTIAHSMVRISGFSQEDSLVDPMCGVGMIPIEAYHYLSKKPNKYRSFMFENFFWINTEEFTEFKRRYSEREVSPDIRGFDINPVVVEYARKNSERAEAQLEFFVSDATRYRFEEDVVCVDLPYGVRLRKINLRKLYSEFFRNLYDCGFRRLTFITAKRNRRFIPEYVIPSKVFHVNYDELETVIYLVEE